uniref:CCHC-type domain-containing protein n=1 Tax=Tanacetum cinerariifolium TaxID=118510 RepID=A0A6L2LSE8_TANCI|nr:hypothetical protein [Tanacetum cinerariifolium]
MTAGMSRQYTSGPSGTLGRQRVIVCYNCKGECHMSKQCTKPKRKRDKASRDSRDSRHTIALMANLSHYGSDNLAEKTDAIVIHDSEETLLLEDKNRSKMLQKQKDPMMSEKKVNTKPVDYAALNQLSKDFETLFVPQTEFTIIVEIPKELPKVKMVNSSLKKLKFHLARFDVSDIFEIFTVKMEILLEPTSNKLLVGDVGDSIWIELVTLDINLGPE